MGAMIYPNTCERLYIGPSGYPDEADASLSLCELIDWCVERGWDTMELAFVHRVFLGAKEAVAVAAHVRERGFPLSCHGSYYVNLASLEEPKIDASRQRIIQAAERIAQAGGHSVVYHSAFMHQRASAEVTPIVIEQTRKIQSELVERDVKVWLRPELTGKPSQHGDTAELIKLANACEMVLPCIDWAHLYARTQGEINSYEQWCELLDKLARSIRNKNVLQRMHMHISGIEYGAKGEKRHLPLQECDLRYKELMQAMQHAGVTGTLIVEAPRVSLAEDIARLRDAWGE
jgi:deoxyribonuclease-4